VKHLKKQPGHHKAKPLAPPVFKGALAWITRGSTLFAHEQFEKDESANWFGLFEKGKTDVHHVTDYGNFEIL
jgi:hypothetical protein